MTRKNPAAVALGRLGGRANTPAQQAARAANGRKGGRPRDPLPSPAALAQRRYRERAKRERAG